MEMETETETSIKSGGPHQWQFNQICYKTVKVCDSDRKQDSKSAKVGQDEEEDGEGVGGELNWTKARGDLHVQRQHYAKDKAEEAEEEELNDRFAYKLQ